MHLPIMLHGNNFDSNRGCQALRLTTQMILDRYVPDYPRLHANIFCNDSPQFTTVEPDAKSVGQLFETNKRGGINYYLWGSMIVASRAAGCLPRTKAARAIDNVTALLVLGGDNLSYDYGLLATLLFFSPIQSAVRKKTPTAVWGASIGPFSKRPRWEKKFADILRRVDLITVREPITQEYLHGLGICENVRRVSDPAFLLPACPVELPREIELALQAGAIGLNLAPLLNRYNRLSPGEWTRHALDILCEIKRRVDRPIILIPHVMMPPSVFPNNDDYQFMQKLHDMLPRHMQESVLLYDARNHSSKQIKWVISRLKAYVGSRLHSIVAAISTCVPVFYLGYGIKSRGIIRDVFGHEEWVIHASRLSSGLVAEQLQTLLQNEATVRSHLNAVVPRHIEAAWKNGEFFRQMLELRGIPT